MVGPVAMSGGVPETLGRVYTGTVMHLRMRPKRHQFRYRVSTLLLDIDRLDAIFGALRLASLDRRGWLSFRRDDHGARDGSALRPWVEARLAEAGLLGPDRPTPARIRLLSAPRAFGYAFNPLSVYYCYGPGPTPETDGPLESIVYQVKNTFGDQYAYAVDVGPEAGGAHRHAARKDFFVSPFIDMEKTYRFDATAPADRFGVRIKETDAEGLYLIATWSGDAEPLTDATLLKRFLRRPMMTRKVTLGIHWEALRLFLKGVPFLGHPGAGKVFRDGGRPALGATAASGLRDSGLVDSGLGEAASERRG